ncbi:right-handed parallel beta-helix repeat-containing protein [Microbacter margulisiae]
MKREPKIYLLLCLLSISATLLGINIYISPTGNDNSGGSIQAPYATLYRALWQARELRRLHKVSVKDTVHIILKGGTYPLYEPLVIRPEDNGTKTSPTIIENAHNEQPIISGGIAITGWEKSGNFQVASVPEFNGNKVNFRQLWINGRKAVRARNVSDFNKMDRILGFNKQTRTLWIPASSVRGLTNIPHTELDLLQMWEVANLRIKSIRFHGDSAGVTFHNPESQIEFEHPWPHPMIQKGNNSPFYLTNNIAFLDQPGEWYYDQDQSKIYYLPRKGEDMNNVKAVIPVLQTLIEIKGTPDHPVQYIQFKGIGFEYAGWTRPSEKGHVPLQAGMDILEGYSLKPPGALGNKNKGLENQAWIKRQPASVSLTDTRNITIKQCKFEHLGACGLDIISGSKFTTVKGCLFRDIAGNGMQIGSFDDNGSIETHMPYHPADKRTVCSDQRIMDNYITNVSNEDWGCVGIAAGFVKNIYIEHNEINDVSYTGISLGWGWTKSPNCMRNNHVIANYVHHYAKHMYDVAGIYTLSAQPKTIIEDNVVDSIYTPSYAHDPNHWFYLYTDEGSSYITIKNNWTPAERFLKNANGPGNVWKNNGPTVSDSIKEHAGLEKKYRFLQKEF